MRWWARLEAEAGRADEPPRPRWGAGRGTGPAARDRRSAGGAAVAAVAELVSSGEPVLALCADARAARPGRLGGGPAPLRRRGAGARLRTLRRRARLGAADAGAGLVLADWGALAQRPRPPRAFQHVVLVDPPPFKPLEEGSAAARGPATCTSPGAPRPSSPSAASRWSGIRAAPSADLAAAGSGRRGPGRGAALAARGRRASSPARPSSPPAACPSSTSSGSASGPPIPAHRA